MGARGDHHGRLPRVLRRDRRVLRKYDENCFDAAYDSEPIETFVPLVREVFSQEPCWS